MLHGWIKGPDRYTDVFGLCGCDLPLESTHNRALFSIEFWRLYATHAFFCCQSNKLLKYSCRFHYIHCLFPINCFKCSCDTKTKCSFMKSFAAQVSFFKLYNKKLLKIIWMFQCAMFTKTKPSIWGSTWYWLCNFFF